MKPCFHDNGPTPKTPGGDEQFVPATHHIVRTSSQSGVSLLNKIGKGDPKQSIMFPQTEKFTDLSLLRSYSYSSLSLFFIWLIMRLFLQHQVTVSHQPLLDSLLLSIIHILYFVTKIVILASIFLFQQ